MQASILFASAYVLAMVPSKLVRLSRDDASMQDRYTLRAVGVDPYVHCSNVVYLRVNLSEVSLDVMWIAPELPFTVVHSVKDVLEKENCAEVPVESMHIAPAFPASVMHFVNLA